MSNPTKPTERPQEPVLSPDLVRSYIHRPVSFLITGFQYEKDLKNDLYRYLFHKGLFEDYFYGDWREHLKI